MKTLGLPLALVLLFSALVAQSGALPALAISAPSTPRNLTALAVSDTKVFLVWDPPVNATGVIGYLIEYKTGSNPYSILISNTGNVTTYLNSGLVMNATYTYRVFAFNSAGEGNPSNEVTVTTLSVPSAPRDLSATVVSSSQINLIWIAPTNDGGTPIKGYNILRDFCTGNGVLIFTTTNASTKYSDSGLTANTCYKYNIEAINAIGSGSSSIHNVTATTKSTPLNTHVPNAPTGLDVKTNSDTSLKLTWVTPSKVESPITGYLIQRNSTVVVIDTNSTATSYIDTNLMPGHKQTYRVAAWNSVGLGPFSNSASGVTNSTVVISGNTNQTSNLGQLISDFVHKRNEILKQQRNETLTLIHECRAQVKNASAEDKKQISQDCKEKLKEVKEKYKDLRNQFKIQLTQLQAEFKSQEHEDENNEKSVNELKHNDNQTTHSEKKPKNHGKGNKEN